MNIMKMNITLILFLLLLLTGCAKPFYYDLDSLENDVISAEIVEPYWTEDSFEITILNEIDVEVFNDLISGLSKIEFEYGGTPRRPTDLALKLNYVDGYEVISNTGIAWFDNDNKIIRYEDLLINKTEFKEFLQKYKIEEYKIKASNDLDAYIEGKDETNYCLDKLNTILRIVNEGKIAIDAAKSKTEVDNAIDSTKISIDEVEKMKVSSGVLYTLQDAYDEGFITREDLMHIAFFASGEVLDKDLNKIDFVPQVEEPKFSDVELSIRCSLKTTIYQKYKDQFDKYNANINNIIVYRYFGEYNGYYAVQVRVPFIHYGASSYLEIVSDITWYHFDAPIIVFTLDKE